MKKTLVLCILDGCGLRENSDGNAFKAANKPIFDYLYNNYPHCKLEASGNYVGLPAGQIGNSEVGHMNIGSGRIVYQPQEIINQSIGDKSFFKNDKILSVLNHVKNNHSTLHIMGLLSDGGVHSHINHLFALIDILKEQNISNVCYHLFLDGRDTKPRSAYTYIEMLLDKIDEVGFGKIVSISGRYYAMDRDNNYDRVKLAYDAIVYNKGKRYSSSKNLITECYAEGITDEYIIPGIIDDGTVNDNDGIITFNFRKDRLRELFTALTNPDISPLETKKLDNLSILTMFPVTKDVKCPHVFDNPDLSNGMGETLYKYGLSQLRIAETEKFAHVTYYYDGGKEIDYKNEKKILIPSPKVLNYRTTPRMSAEEITDNLIKELENGQYDVVILNYSNGDMIGHTGDCDAAIEAIEYLDVCLGKLFDMIKKIDGTLIVTADHGNCELMWDEMHIPMTNHTTSLVPFIITCKDIDLHDGFLADIAPTMLDLLNLPKPECMTGNSLIVHK